MIQVIILGTGLTVQTQMVSSLEYIEVRCTEQCRFGNILV